MFNRVLNTPQHKCLKSVRLTKFKGCACYILASLFFLSLKESFCKTRKNVFYFTSKALCVLEKIKV